MRPAVGLTSSLARRQAGQGLALTLGLAAALAIPGAAQQSLPAFEEEWRWADYGLEAGVPEGPVLGMGSDGTRTWVYTGRGLAWFDDYQWHSMAPIDGLRYGRLATHEGAVSVVTDYKLQQVAYSDQGLPLRLEVFAGLEDYRVFGIAYSSTGDLYAVLEDQATGNARLARLASGAPEWIETPEPIDLSLPVGMATAESGLFLGTRGGLRVLRPDGSWESVFDHPGAAFSLIVPGSDDEGIAFLSHPTESRGLIRWTEAGIERVDEEGENGLRAATIDQRGVTLALWDTGDLRQGVGDSWTEVQVPGDRVQGLNFAFTEASGDLWLASRSGLHLFRRFDARWTRIRRPFPDLANRINVIITEDDGGFAVGSAGGVTVHDAGGTLVRWTSANGQELKHVTGLIRDERGRYLISSGSAFPGVFRRTLDGPWEHLAADAGLGVRIHRLFKAPDGRVYAAALSGLGTPGLYRIDEDRAELVSEGVRVLGGGVYAVDFGPDGTIWVGGFWGLARLTPNGSWTEWTREELGEEISRLFEIALAPDGRIWMSTGTTAGYPLRVFDPATGESQRAASPPRIGPEGIWGLDFDNLGRLWATSVQGVSLLTESGRTMLDHRSGLVGQHAWPIVATDQRVLVGTAAGLQLLNLAAADIPPSIITEIRTEYEPGRLEFEWQVFPYRGSRKPDEIETRYRLDGGDWSDWSVERQPGFDGLGRDEHTLEVEARNLLGVPGPSLIMTASVPAPLILRPVFALPLSVLLALLGVASTLAVRRKAHADRAIRESERRLRAYLDQAPESILLFDMHRRVLVDSNDSALTLLDRERRSIVGMRLDELDQRDSGGSGSDSLAELVEKAAAQGQTDESRRSIVRPDGSVVPVAIHLVRLPEPESHLIRISVVDRSEQEEAERQRQAMEVQLVQAQKLEAVGQLTGGIAHDFNNLLTVIHGNLEFLRATTEGEARRFADQALLAAERGGELVRRLLAFSMRQALAPKPLDLVDALQDIMPLLERALGASIALEMKVDDPLPFITVDRSQLDNAILNCCINARDAMPDGGTLAIRAATGSISEDMAHAAEVPVGVYVRISIEDSGTGIPPEVLEKVFEPFFTTKDVGKGSGLGLSMVYGFARQSGGFARIQSRAGEGTKVHLYFPAQINSPVAKGDQRPDGLPGGAGSGRGDAVVVEDDPHLRGLMEHFLTRQGFQVVSFETAAAAEAHLGSAPAPALVLVDAILPGGGSGFDWLCDFPPLNSVPAVAISGSSPEVISGFDRLGAIPFLQKPFTLRSLEDAISRACPPGATDSGDRLN